MPALYSNNTVGTIQTGVGVTDTVITLLPGHGSAFPNPDVDEYFFATLVNETTGALEIVKVVDRVNDTLTVERGVDNSSPAVFPAGSKLEMRLIAEMLRELRDSGDFVAKAGDTMTGPLSFTANGVTWTITPDPVTGNLSITSNNDEKQIDIFVGSNDSTAGAINLGRARHSMPVITIAGNSAEVQAKGATGARGALLVCTSAGTVSLAIRKNTGSEDLDWRLGDFFTVVQRGGQVTVTVAATGATLLVPSGAVAKTRAINSTITLTCIDPTNNVWLASSDLALA